MELRNMFIGEDAALTDALAALNGVGGQVLFVLREEKLLAAVTDGDIRRYIIKTGSVEAKVREVANYSPKYLVEENAGEAHAMMKRYGIPAVPVVDGDMRIQRVIFREAEAAQDACGALDAPVVINAGGKGTRLYPYTKILPKPLIPIGDEPIAEIIIKRFRHMGCARFYMILNHKKNMIKAYFGEAEKDYALEFIDEDAPLGTGGGLSLLKGRVEETFVFANCDTVIEEDFCKIFKAHRESGNLITMIAALKHFDIPYGVVQTGENGCITGFEEKPQMSFLTNTGCYIVEPEVISHMRPGEAVAFPAVIERCRQAGEPVGIYPISEHEWLDMGQFQSMEEMRKRLENE